MSSETGPRGGSPYLTSRLKDQERRRQRKGNGRAPLEHVVGQTEGRRSEVQAGVERRCLYAVVPCATHTRTPGQRAHVQVTEDLDPRGEAGVNTGLTLEPDPDPLSLNSPVTRCQLLSF